MVSNDISPKEAETKGKDERARKLREELAFVPLDRFTVSDLGPLFRLVEGYDLSEEEIAAIEGRIAQLRRKRIREALDTVGNL